MIKFSGILPLLQVYDMQVAMDFYCNKLGFEIKDASGEWCWLKLQEVEIMLNTIYEKDERPPIQDSVRTAQHGDVILYIGCNDVPAMYQQLLAKGMAIDPPALTGYGLMALNLFDPDGYNLCFQ
jgi:glyoxylase I family protein